MIGLRPNIFISCRQMETFLPESIDMVVDKMFFFCVVEEGLGLELDKTISTWW